MCKKQVITKIPINVLMISQYIPNILKIQCQFSTRGQTPPIVQSTLCDMPIFASKKGSNISTIFPVVPHFVSFVPHPFKLFRLYTVVKIGDCSKIEDDVYYEPKPKPKISEDQRSNYCLTWVRPVCARGVVQNEYRGEVSADRRKELNR